VESKENVLDVKDGLRRVVGNKKLVTIPYESTN
jgi:hypothetical protein